MKAVALISHRFGNIGHTFMSLGMEEIVREAFGPEVLIGHYEQHKVFDIYPPYHPLRTLDLLPHGRMTWARRPLSSRRACQMFWPGAHSLRKYHLAINCGGPSMTRGAGHSADMKLMFWHKMGAFAHHGVPVLDLGVGSGAFGFENLPGKLDDALDKTDQAYFRRLFEYVALTTTRDPLAHQLHSWLGRETPLVPCAAIASGRWFERHLPPPPPLEEKVILINFQKYGANEDWGQKVDPDIWKKTVQELISRLRNQYRFEFLCHNKAEFVLAESVNASLPRHLPATPEEYARLIGRARAGLVSRIHAAIPLAGIGIPSIAIGTDSRLGTLELMGLKTFFVKQVTTDLLEKEINLLVERAPMERERLLKVRENTIQTYAGLCRQYARKDGPHPEHRRTSP